ncbi:MAG: polysaccharide deacetylase family protein [Paludibacteraceae bacterium]|nr:polysaccharide deacetylase family protein [Paludibacteraceae bacterium]
MSADEKAVYLTFDDGCVPEVTPLVLDILLHYGVRATFFCVGDNLLKYPEVFQRMVNEGHIPGNHTFHHVPGLRVSVDSYIEEVGMTDKQIEKNLSGHLNHHLFRPPYGRFSYKQKRALSRTHKIFLWDVLTHDYNPRYTPDKILSIVKTYTRNGSIIVFHDSIKAKNQMLPALPKVIEYLQQEGYKFKTLN